jgi:thiopeptide-type bacteriocin biosynthesis protein
MAWKQSTVWFSTAEAAERVAVADLGPLMSTTEDAGLITAWWFIRKRGRKLRWLPAPGAADRANAAVATGLQALADRSAVTGCRQTCYEPETVALGGPAGLEIAHQLFHADSRQLLAYLAAPEPARLRRETTLLLCTALLRGAGLDWYEQGDVWARFAAHRQRDAGQLAQPHDPIVASVHRLMLGEPTGPSSPFLDCPQWLKAFTAAGEALAQLAEYGELTRGLRAICTHHLLFAFNRSGVPGPQQAILATAAEHAVFRRDPPGLRASAGSPSAPTTSPTVVP